MKQLSRKSSSEHWHRPTEKDCVLLLIQDPGGVRLDPEYATDRNGNGSNGSSKENPLPYLTIEWDLENKSFVDIDQGDPRAQSADYINEFFASKLFCVRQDAGCAGLFSVEKSVSVGANRFHFRDSLIAMDLNKFLMETKLGDTFTCEVG